MKEDNKNKLAAYTTLAATLAGTTGLQAQIKYTALTPPDTVDTNEEIIDIDLDQDGNPDFRLQLIDTLAAGNDIGAVYAFAYPNSGSEISGLFGLNYPYPFKLNPFDAIDSNSQWLNTLANGSMAFVIDGNTPYGEQWNGGVTDGYLGLRLRKTFDTAYYGWARLDVAADGKSFILKDFAVEETPNVGISAGIMNVQELMAQRVKLWAANGKLVVRIPEGGQFSDLVVHDVAGREILRHTLKAREEDVQLPEGSAGVVLVTLSGTDGKRTFRLVVR